MGHRGYVTLIMWREDGFVFSGEQLDWPWCFNSSIKNQTLLRGRKTILLVDDSIRWVFLQHLKKKRTTLMFNNPQLIIFGPPFKCHSCSQLPKHTPLMIENIFCQVLVF